MSTKPKSVTIASLDSEEQAALAILERVKQGREAAKQEAATQVTEQVKGLLAKVSKILGREINLGELVGIVSAVAKDKPLFASVANGSTGALTPEKSQQIKDAMHARAAALRAGMPAESISAICARLGTTAQTCHSRKPTKAEYEAMPGTVDAESAYQAPSAA